MFVDQVRGTRVVQEVVVPQRLVDARQKAIDSLCRAVAGGGCIDSVRPAMARPQARQLYRQ